MYDVYVEVSSLHVCCSSCMRAFMRACIHEHTHVHKHRYPDLHVLLLVVVSAGYCVRAYMRVFILGPINPIIFSVLDQSLDGNDFKIKINT